MVAPEAHDAAADVADSTSVELTQSSCSKEAMCSGGIKARTYSISMVVSAEMPLAVRYSSMEVRRNVPLIKNSNGIGFSLPSRLLTSVDSAYRRRPIE